MINWIKRHSFALAMIFIISIIPATIAIEVILYKLEPRSKVYVEWTVYDGLSNRDFHGTYDMAGKEFEIQNYWESAGRYRGSYRVVRIVDKDAWCGYINKQSICIYTGLNDVEVKKLKVLETKY